MNEVYFEKLAAYARSLLDQLPVSKEVKPLEHTISKLYGIIKDKQKTETERIRKLWCYKRQKQNAGPHFTGLNTIGMLCDRFTILLIREWCLRNKHNDPLKADELYEQQTCDIIKALAVCKPGNASLNSKITGIETTVSASDWEDAFYQLLGINLVLWESQEVLYMKDILTLPDKELRDYIRWFSRGNLERNVLIELAESCFWEKAGKE